MQEIRPEELVTLDCETYYDTEYSLTKMSTSEYIRDPRFKLHLVSVKVGEGKTEWMSGESFKRWTQQFNWSDYILNCHNTPFDGFILSHYFNVRPKMYADTLSMSRAVHGQVIRHGLNALCAKYNLPLKLSGRLEASKGIRDLTPDQLRSLGEYSIGDTENASKLFWLMYPFVPDDEMQLIHLTTRMFCQPQLEVDRRVANQVLKQEIGGKAKAVFLAGVTKETLTSRDKFAQALQDAGARVPMKLNSVGTATYAFAKSDEEFKALMQHPSERVRALVDARIKVQSAINETRATRLLKAGEKRQKLPVLLLYCGAHTTRWSGGNKLNLQNLPKKSGLRNAVKAPKGKVMVIVDSAQIEARITAWLAEQTDLVNGFKNGVDVYREMAASIYGVPAADVTKDQRFVGKTCILGLGFGMGYKKLVATLQKDNITLTWKEADRVVQLYRAKYPMIPNLWDTMKQCLGVITHGGTTSYKVLSFGQKYVKLPNGLFLHYDIRVDETGEYKTHRNEKIYGALLTENVVQALARCIIGEQMLKIDEQFPVVMMSHDEIVALADKDEAEEAKAFMLQVMRTPPSWAHDLPLNAEGTISVRYEK